MKVLNCTELLTLHLKAHGLTTIQYFQQYIEQKDEEIVPPMPQIPTENVITRFDKEADPIPAHDTTPDQKYNMYSNRYNRKELALSWSSGYTYQCQICNRIYSK